MDDQTLHWWASFIHTWEVGSLVVAAIAAISLGASVWLSKEFAHEIHERESTVFQKYKIDSGVRIEEAKKEGIEAGKTAADAMLRAAGLEKEAALAKERAVQLEKGVAEANARAAEARLALERFKAPRWIADDHAKKFIARLGQFQDTSADVWLLHGSTADAGPFAARLLSVLNSAKWKVKGVNALLGGHSGAGSLFLREKTHT